MLSKSKLITLKRQITTERKLLEQIESDIKMHICGGGLKNLSDFCYIITNINAVSVILKWIRKEIVSEILTEDVNEELNNRD